jgi:sigma-B regulation protein RsbU (phosphoserine phosphatase)
MFSAHAHAVPAPAQTMTLVNDTLVRRAVEARFATLWFAVLSSDGELTYCNAGHNSPILIRKRGVRRLETGGTIVGVFKQASFEQEVLQMEPGDTLVVFSDGVTEALNCDYQEFGEERLFACLQAQYELPAASLVASLLHELRLFSVGAEQSDDLTVLVLRYFGREFSRVSVGTTA